MVKGQDKWQLYEAFFVETCNAIVTTETILQVTSGCRTFEIFRCCCFCAICRNLLSPQAKVPNVEDSPAYARPWKTKQDPDLPIEPSEVLDVKYIITVLIKGLGK